MQSFVIESMMAAAVLEAWPLVHLTMPGLVSGPGGGPPAQNEERLAVRRDRVFWWHGETYGGRFAAWCGTGPKSTLH